MTYPQQPYPPQPPQPGYPAQPQTYAPPPPQAPAPQYAPQPGYPPGPAYAPPPQPQFQQPVYQQPQQGYPPYPQEYAGPFTAPELRMPEMPPATLSDFMTQPASAGGKSLPFNVPGTRYAGTVVRNVTDADIEVATEVRGGGIAKHPDGRVKVIMKVPLLMQPSAEFPTGIGVWYVKGNERSELLRAMEAAGAEPGPPRGGDMIDVTYTHDEPGRAGMSPRKVKRVVYTKGNGVAPELPVAAQAAPAQLQGPPPGYPQQQQYAPPPQQYQYQQPAVQYAPAPGTAYAPPPQQYQAPVAQQFPPTGMPDPARAYQQATGQPMPPQYQGSVPYQDYSYQQPPPTAPMPGAAPAAPGYTNGAPPTAAASPSSVPGGPPPGWPPDVPFIPGLTPDQARVAATMHHPAATGQPQ